MGQEDSVTLRIWAEGEESSVIAAQVPKVKLGIQRDQPGQLGTFQEDMGGGGFVSNQLFSPSPLPSVTTLGMED